MTFDISAIVAMFRVSSFPQRLNCSRGWLEKFLDHCGAMRLVYFGGLGSIGVEPRTPRISSSTLAPASSWASPRGGATIYSPTGRPEAVNPQGSDSAGQHASVIA
jgi:hypothetical protein